ncbi:MAG: TetR/AcrR family transcriptional regulator [Desulfotomaculaceae bacterium]|nr:TetR/AcrR family transcriptional regulator [Desulfotomaculaceae bacterium]
MEKRISDRELSILHAAIRVFSQKGFNGATTKEIAQEAGVAEGTIFRYFSTKKDILHQILMRAIETVIADMAIPSLEKALAESEGQNPEVVFANILQNRLSFIDQNLDLFKVIFTEIQYHEDLRNIYIKNIYGPGRRIIGGFIEQGMASGIFRKELDVDFISRYLVSVFIMFITERRLYSFDENVDQEFITRVIDIIFYGIKGGKTYE